VAALKLLVDAANLLVHVVSLERDGEVEASHALRTGEEFVHRNPEVQELVARIGQGMGQP
jgi:hypothetical protein